MGNATKCGGCWREAALLPPQQILSCLFLIHHHQLLTSSCAVLLGGPAQLIPVEAFHLELQLFFFLFPFFLIRYTLFCKGYCKNSSVSSNKVNKCWQICCTTQWCVMFPEKWAFATSEWGQTSHHRWCTPSAWNSTRLQPNKPKEKTLQAERDWFEVLHSFLLVMAHHNRYVLISQEKKMAFGSGSVSSMKLLSWCGYLYLCIYSILFVFYDVAHVNTR